MRKFIHLLTFILVSALPLTLLAEEGFIGENPGFDFYSKIDEWNFTVLKKSINARLKETPTLDVFGNKCAQASSLLKGIPTTPEMLDSIKNMDYTQFYAQILKNAWGNPSNKITITSDLFQNITNCLREQYQVLEDDTKRATDARVNISYLWLYMDGDKNNSDYDIITDIEKINMVIFSQDLKYGGTSNQAGKWLSNFLANKAVAPLFPMSTILANNTNNPSVPSSPIVNGNTPNTPTPSSSSSDLSALLGGTCSSTTPVWPISNIVDDAFLADLAWVLASGGWGWSVGDGSSLTSSQPASSSATGNAQSNLTSAGDFFHEIPCNSTFCIKVKMIPWGSSGLIWGKNVSIEGILDKHTKIMLPISESALGCEVMTNNTASSPKKWLNLISTLAGLKVYLAEKPQVTRRDKKEATPQREAEELKDIQRCGYASVWLPTDEARARSMIGGWYNTTQWRNTENVGNGKLALGPQESAEVARFTNCIASHMQTWRNTYYDSFSTDVTEIQAYTANMLNEINSIISILTEMNSKKWACS
jgi:hypothetical protein